MLLVRWLRRTAKRVRQHVNRQVDLPIPIVDVEPKLFVQLLLGAIERAALRGDGIEILHQVGALQHARRRWVCRLLRLVDDRQQLKLLRLRRLPILLDLFRARASL